MDNTQTTKTQRVYEDGLIASEPTSTKIPVTAEALVYQQQQQQQHHIPVMPSPPVDHGHYYAGPPNPYSDKTYYQPPPSEYPPTQFTQNNLEGPSRTPSLLRRKSTWIIVFLVIVVAVLAGIVGGIASGSIKTSANSAPATAAAATGGTTTDTPTPTKDSAGEADSASKTSSSSEPTKTPAGTTLPKNPKVETTTVETEAGTVTLECPSADGLDYNIVNAKGQPMVFARYCDTNFPEGDLGLVEDKTILSMPECIELCANTDKCVGVIFNSLPNCWLKGFIGKATTDAFGTEAAILQQ